MNLRRDQYLLRSRPTVKIEITEKQFLISISILQARSLCTVNTFDRKRLISQDLAVSTPPIEPCMRHEYRYNDRENLVWVEALLSREGI